MVANPIPKAAIPYSHKGVLNTLSVPYFAFNSMVHRKTPPKIKIYQNLTKIFLWINKLFISNTYLVLTK